MNLNYKDDVRIEETALEQEWLDQADLAIKYGREWSHQRHKVAMLDEKVKTIRSELINKAWGKPEKLTGGKASVQTVEAFYRTDKKYIKAKAELIDAQLELDLMEVAKNEISFTRKAILENLTKLFMADYFAGPSVPRDIVKERKNREESRKEANDQMKPIKRKKDKKKKKSKKDK